MLLTPTHIYRKYHISTCFLIKIIFFHFPPKEKISYFLEKRNTIFPDITKKFMFRREFLGKTIFSEHLKKISYFQEFFWEISSFLLCLKNKIIFSGKQNKISSTKLLGDLVSLPQNAFWTLKEWVLEK